MKKQHVLLAVIAVLAIFYLVNYNKLAEGTGIIQTTVEGFEWDMLFSKQPIVVEDQIKDIFPLLVAWFGKMKTVPKNQVTDDFSRNKFKYLAVYSLQSTEVLIRHPNSEDAIAIKLDAYQLVIVPHRWYYLLPPASEYEAYGYHDWISWL